MARTKIDASLVTPIRGTTTSDDAASGNIGEYVASDASSAFPSSGSVGNLTSISLTAGDWDVSVSCRAIGIATCSVTDVFMGASTNSGNTFTGLTRYTSTEWAPSSAATGVFTFPLSKSSIRFSLASTTTVYFKVFATYTTATPNVDGAITARRVR